MDRHERRRIERRIAKAERRLARSIDERQQKYEVRHESKIKQELIALLTP